MLATIDIENLYELIQAADADADERRSCARETHDTGAMIRTRYLYQSIRAARRAIADATKARCSDAR